MRSNLIRALIAVGLVAFINPSSTVIDKTMILTKESTTQYPFVVSGISGGGTLNTFLLSIKPPNTGHKWTIDRITVNFQVWYYEIFIATGFKDPRATAVVNPNLQLLVNGYGINIPVPLIQFPDSNNTLYYPMVPFSNQPSPLPVGSINFDLPVQVGWRDTLQLSMSGGFSYGNLSLDSNNRVMYMEATLWGNREKE